MSWPTLAVLILFLFSGCLAKVKVFPEVAHYPDQVEVLVRGKILCDGDKKYIPRTVEDGGGFSESRAIHYIYEDEGGYVRDPVRVGPIIIGKGDVREKGVGVVGRLEIREGKKIIKAYGASAVMTVMSEFSSETLSEMRRRGLMAVRDNIEAQMWEDREFLNTVGTGKIH